MLDRPHHDPEGIALLLSALQLPPPCHSLLVAPCREGQACLELVQHGYRVTGMDRNEALVALARERAAEKGRRIAYHVGSVENASMADRHFDAAICLGLYEMLDDEGLRERVVAELCRIASRYVLLSYATPFALAGITSPYRAGMGTALARRTSLRSLRAKFASRGFRLRADLPRRRLLHPLHLAVFQRG